MIEMSSFPKEILRTACKRALWHGSPSDPERIKDYNDAQAALVLKYNTLGPPRMGLEKITTWLEPHYILQCAPRQHELDLALQELCGDYLNVKDCRILIIMGAQCRPQCERICYHIKRLLVQRLWMTRQTFGRDLGGVSSGCLRGSNFFVATKFEKSDCNYTMYSIGDLLSSIQVCRIYLITNKEMIPNPNKQSLIRYIPNPVQSVEYNNTVQKRKTLQKEFVQLYNEKGPRSRGDFKKALMTLGSKYIKQCFCTQADLNWILQEGCSNVLPKGVKTLIMMGAQCRPNCDERCAIIKIRLVRRWILMRYVFGGDLAREIHNILARL